MPDVIIMHAWNGKSYINRIQSKITVRKETNSKLYKNRKFLIKERDKLKIKRKLKRDRIEYDLMCKTVRYNITKYIKTYNDNIIIKNGLGDSANDNEKSVSLMSSSPSLKFNPTN